MNHLEIEYINIDQLTPYENNARKHGKKDIDNIALSIERYGMNDAIGIWGDKNIIVEGHGRVLACKKLGIDAVPCIRLDHLTDEQRREYAIAHNATAELSEWDFESLEIETVSLDFDGFDFEMIETDFCGDYNAKELNSDTSSNISEIYEQKNKEVQKQIVENEFCENNKEYQDFVQKFKPKKTTDDCYTPPEVYEAVASYVEDRYGVDRSNFIRPFYPGENYKAKKYLETDIVVDNPPFSIMSEIIRFYNENAIKFFLFAPHLTIFSISEKYSSIITGTPVVYENGANVNTSFVTNLEDCVFRSCPDLYERVNLANKQNLKTKHKELPKYKYPKNVITSPMIVNFSKYGIDFEIHENECHFIRALDSQKQHGKSLFGNGYLISNSKKAERKIAEIRVDKEKRKNINNGNNEDEFEFQLSDREIEIINKLE